MMEEEGTQMQAEEEKTLDAVFVDAATKFNSQADVWVAQVTEKFATQLSLAGEEALGHAQKWVSQSQENYDAHREMFNRKWKDRESDLLQKHCDTFAAVGQRFEEFATGLDRLYNTVNNAVVQIRTAAKDLSTVRENLAAATEKVEIDVQVCGERILKRFEIIEDRMISFENLLGKQTCEKIVKEVTIAPRVAEPTLNADVVMKDVTPSRAVSENRKGYLPADEWKSLPRKEQRKITRKRKNALLKSARVYMRGVDKHTGVKRHIQREVDA